MSEERDSQKRNSYIYGNAVRKSEVFEPLPDDYEKEQRKREKEAKRRALERQIQRDRKKARPFSLIQTGALIVALGGLVMACRHYIGLEAQMSENISEISTMQSEYHDLVSQNNMNQAKIDANIDYDAIKQYAMEKLGMDYPQKSQVITYDGVESEYVRQNDQIPQE